MSYNNKLMNVVIDSEYNTRLDKASIIMSNIKFKTIKMERNDADRPKFTEEEKNEHLENLKRRYKQLIFSKSDIDNGKVYKILVKLVNENDASIRNELYNAYLNPVKKCRKKKEYSQYEWECDALVRLNLNEFNYWESGECSLGDLYIMTKERLRNKYKFTETDDEKITRIQMEDDVKTKILIYLREEEERRVIRIKEKEALDLIETNKEIERMKIAKAKYGHLFTYTKTSSIN